MTEVLTPLTELRDKILKEREAGNIVYWGLPDELCVAKLDDFIKQPATGMLYDLNRLEEISLTFLSDPKWVNDFAVATVIRRLDDNARTLERRLQLAESRNAELERAIEDAREIMTVIESAHGLGASHKHFSRYFHISEETGKRIADWKAAIARQGE